MSGTQIDASIPLQALGAGGPNKLPVPTNPLAVASDFAGLQAQMNQNKLFSQTFAAKQRAGQIMAATPDMETAVQQIAKDPVAGPYAGEIIGALRGANQTLVATQGMQASQARDAFGAAMKASAAAIADPGMFDRTMQEQLQLLPPEIQARVAPAMKTLRASLLDGLPADQGQAAQLLKHRLVGGYIGAGGEPGGLANILGTPTMVDQGGAKVPGVMGPSQLGGGFLPSGQALPMTMAPQVVEVPGTDGSMQKTVVGGNSAAPVQVGASGNPLGVAPAPRVPVQSAPMAAPAPGTPDNDEGAAASPKTQGAVTPGGGVSKITGVQVPDLVTVKAPGGAPFRVAESAAPQFQGLVNDLEGMGYKIKPETSGGYNDRMIAGTNTPSNHARGLAIDVNSDDNARGAKTSSDIPPWLGNQLAAKWGLTWGGNWSGETRDPMHFEVSGVPKAAAPANGPSGPSIPGTPLGPPSQSTSAAEYAKGVGSTAADLQHEFAQSSMALPAMIQRTNAMINSLKGFQAGGGANFRTEMAGMMQAAKNAGASFVTQKDIDDVGNGSIADSQVFKSLIKPFMIKQLVNDTAGTGKLLKSEVEGNLDTLDRTTDPAAIMQVLNLYRQQLQIGYDRASKSIDFKQAIARHDPSVAGLGLEDYPTWYARQLNMSKLPSETPGGMNIGQVPASVAKGVAGAPPDLVWDKKTGKVVPYVAPATGQ